MVLRTAGEVWTFLGFPTYGGGPFERWGIPVSVALLTGFVVVCAAEVLVGVLLWRDGTTAQWLALALLPVEFAYWIGFALPFGAATGTGANRAGGRRPGVRTDGQVGSPGRVSAAAPQSRRRRVSVVTASRICDMAPPGQWYLAPTQTRQ